MPVKAKPFWDRASKGRTFKPYGNQRRYGIKDAELERKVGL